MASRNRPRNGYEAREDEKLPGWVVTVLCIVGAVAVSAMLIFASTQ